MKKKKPTQQPISTTSHRYKEGDEFLYIYSKQSMSRVRIEKIIPGGYLLSNQIQINDSLKRIDADHKKYEYKVLPWDSIAEQIFNAYHAYNKLLKAINKLNKELVSKNPFDLSEEDQTRVIYLNKKITKALDK